MNIWTTVKRLNRRFDCWSAHEADKIVANLDRTGDGNRGDTKRYSQDTKRHISVWDLLAKNRRSDERKPFKGK